MKGETELGITPPPARSVGRRGLLALRAQTTALLALRAQTIALLAIRGPTLALLAVLPLLAARGAPLAAQRYSETLRTTVTTRSGLASVHRFVVRDVDYLRSRRADTLVMQAVAVRLEETVDGPTRTLDTDGFTGGRWKLLPDSAGEWRPVVRPFVPEPLLEVNDLAAAMDDFFPARPPAMITGEDVRDATGRSWERLADSAGVSRYRWTFEQALDTVRVVADSVPLTVEETSRESGSGAWDATGPLAWQRRIDTTSRSTIRERTVMAVVEHRITVRRHD